MALGCVEAEKNSSVSSEGYKGGISLKGIRGY